MRMSDLAVGDLALVAEYYQLYNSGDIAGALAFLQAHPQLESKIFNAKKFNKLIDAVLAAQRFFRDGVDGFLDGLQAQVDEFAYLGEYDPSVIYVKNNVVSYLKCAYVCRQKNVGDAPVFEQSTIYWGLIARGIKGESGTGLAPRGVWGASTTYYPDDLVSYKNRFWQCVTGITNSEPGPDNDAWLEIMSFLPLTGATWGDLMGA